MGSMNLERASWARTAVDAFMGETGQDCRHELEEGLKDLACNILHLASAIGLNAESVSQHAWDTYQAEVIDDE